MWMFVCKFKNNEAVHKRTYMHEYTYEKMEIKITRLPQIEKKKKKDFKREDKGFKGQLKLRFKCMDFCFIQQ